MALLGVHHLHVLLDQVADGERERRARLRERHALGRHVGALLDAQPLAGDHEAARLRGHLAAVGRGHVGGLRAHAEDAGVLPGLERHLAVLGRARDQATERRLGAEGQRPELAAETDAHGVRRRPAERRREALGERAQRGRVRVGRAPAVAPAERDERVHEQLEARLVALHARDGARHLGDGTRLAREDQAVAAGEALLEAAVLLLALVEADHDAVPQAPDQALDGGRLRVALAREGERHFGHPLEVQELRPARQLGRVTRVELAGVGERGERPRPLRERLAVDEVAVVGAERLVERVGERVEELLVDGEAAGARVDQELHAPGRERDVAAAAGPVADQAVGVDGGREPLEDVAHRARRGLLAALLGEHAAELAEREERRGAAESLLGAAVGVALEEIEAGRHAQQRRLVGDEHRAAHGAGPRGLGDRGQRDRRAGAQLREQACGHALAVVADGELHLEGVAHAVGEPLDGHLEGDLVAGELALGGVRRRGHLDRELDALGALGRPGDLARGRAGDRRPLRRDLRLPRAALAFHDAADAGGRERVAGADEARERRLHDDREPHRHLAGREAEALGAAHRLGAELEVGQVVGERYLHGRHAVGADLDRRVVVRHRLEAPAHGDLLEEAGLLALAARAPRLLGERQVAEDEAARVAHGEPRPGVDEEVRDRVEALLLPEGQDGLVDEPERHLARERLLPRVAEADRHRDRVTRARLRRVLERHVDAVVDRVHLDPRRGGDGRGLAQVRLALRRGGGAGDAAAHQDEVDGELRSVGPLHGELQGRAPALHLDPLIRVALRPLGDGERAALLEGALQHERGRLPGVVGLLVGRDLEDARRRLGPGDGLGAAGVEVDADHLCASETVMGLELDDVDARVVERQVEGRRLLAARDGRLGDLLVDHVGHVAGHAVREVAGAEVRVPLAVQQPHLHLGALLQAAIRADHDHLGRDLGRALEVARHLEPEDEGRERDDVLRVGDGLVVGAGHRRLDHVGARLRGRLDGGVEGELRGAVLVGGVVLLELA